MLPSDLATISWVLNISKVENYICYIRFNIKEIGLMGKLVDILNKIAPFGYIKEAGLHRLITRVNVKDFAIGSAWRNKYPRSENKVRQRQLHDMIKSQGMGRYRLVGCWRETPDGVSYDADKEELADLVEDSVLFIRPDDMERGEFIEFVVEVCKNFNQDTVIIGLDKGGEQEYISTSKKSDDQRESVPNTNVYLYDKQVDRTKVGDKHTVNQIAQAYSRMRGKENIPFVFEGILHPINNMSRQRFKVNNTLYLKK